MGTPLDIAAGTAGFASLGIILLQGCIKGFALICTAKNYDKDSEIARCEIEVQQYRLFCWAERTGLNSGQPDPRLNWAVIKDQLSRLEVLLTDIDKFKTEYGLHMVVTDEDVATEHLEDPKFGVRRLVAQVRPDLQSGARRLIQKHASVWKRLKWATIDKEGLLLLANDIRRGVDSLSQLLQDSESQFIRDALEALLLHTISQASGTADLSGIEQLLDRKRGYRDKSEGNAIATALRMKQRRLMLDFEEERKPKLAGSRDSSVGASTGTVSVKSTTKVSGLRKPVRRSGSNIRRPLDFGLLRKTSTHTNDIREAVEYDNQPSLVEWKRIEQGMESKLKHRVKTLAMLLESIDCPSFHSLNCSGYLKDPTTGWYGYVFQFPEQQLSHFSSLSETIGKSAFYPSLGDRMCLAINLFETILQLHTSGWLHKGIRSDNILFFHESLSNFSISQPYLEGYEYARADNPSDITESPALQQEADLYRHPALLRTNRLPFCKAYDLFALGCVLVEIGLWQSLLTTLLRRSRAEGAEQAGRSERYAMTDLTCPTKEEAAKISADRAFLLTEEGPGTILEMLRFFAGSTFAEVVKRCFGAGDLVDEDEDEDEACIDLELDILQLLKQMKV